jgi:hypothetical protein
MKIKSTSDAVLFAGDYASVKSAVEAAVEANADLSGADLYGADLTGANLYDADLRSANLTGANLRSANLRSANLRSANLRYANLRYADLTGAYLTDADLTGVALRAFVQLAFAGHGECGRQLIAIQTSKGKPVLFFCGCFRGSLKELKAYIKDGDRKYRWTRTLALNTVLKLLKVKRA